MSKHDWASEFRAISEQGETAAFGADFGGLNLNPRATLSDFRPPFSEPDPRVFLMENAAVPSRPNYDVFGAGDDKASLSLPDWVKNVGGAFTVIPHGPAAPGSAPTKPAASTFSTVGALAGLISALVGAFALGHHMAHSHRRAH